MVRRAKNNKDRQLATSPASCWSLSGLLLERRRKQYEDYLATPGWIFQTAWSRSFCLGFILDGQYVFGGNSSCRYGRMEI